MADLTTHGLIFRHFRHKNAIPAYHSDEIWRFSKGITLGWISRHQARGFDNWVSIQVAAKRVDRASWQVMAMIAENQLSVARPNRYAKGISKLLVDPKEIQAAFSAADASVITFRDASKILKCSNIAIENRTKVGTLMEQKPHERRPNVRSLMVYLRGVTELASTLVKHD